VIVSFLSQTVTLSRLEKSELSEEKGVDDTQIIDLYM
jgi:hypothetical protein